MAPDDLRESCNGGHGETSVMHLTALDPALVRSIVEGVARSHETAIACRHLATLMVMSLCVSMACLGAVLVLAVLS